MKRYFFSGGFNTVAISDKHAAAKYKRWLTRKGLLLPLPPFDNPLRVENVR